MAAAAEGKSILFGGPACVLVGMLLGGGGAGGHGPLTVANGDIPGIGGIGGIGIIGIPLSITQ